MNSLKIFLLFAVLVVVNPECEDDLVIAKNELQGMEALLHQQHELVQEKQNQIDTLSKVLEEAEDKLSLLNNKTQELRKKNNLLENRIVDLEQSYKEVFEKYDFWYVVATSSSGFTCLGVCVLLYKLLPVFFFYLFKVLKMFSLAGAWLVGIPSRMCSSFRDRSGVHEYIELVEQQAMLPGSSLLPLVSGYPRCQVTVYVSDNIRPSQKHFAGYGFRVEDYIILPYHVIRNGVNVTLVNSNDTERKIELPRTAFKELKEDVAYLDVDARITSSLQLAKGTIYGVTSNVGHMVTISARSYSVNGLLTEGGELAIGTVAFRGSTINGFSGAPYMVNKSVAGMHIGSSTLGMGLEIKFILSLIKKQRQMAETLEDSEDWLISSIKKRGSKVAYSFSRHNPGDVWLKFDGEYHTLSNDAFRELQPYLYEMGDKLINTKIRLTEENYKDVDRLSVEICQDLPTPAKEDKVLDLLMKLSERLDLIESKLNPVVSEPLEELNPENSSSPAFVAGHGLVQEENAQRENTQVRSSPIQMAYLEEMPKIMAGLASTLVQQNAVSLDMLKFLKDQKTVHQNLLQTVARQQKKLSPKVVEPGPSQ